MRRSTRGMAWALCLAACAIAMPLGAQPGEDPAALFRQGKELYAEGKYEAAYQAYRRAFELQPAFDIAGNLGNVEVKLGKHRDAVIHLRYVLANLPPSYDPQRREQIIQRTKELLAESLKHVASIKLAITPDGTQVSVDSESFGTTPLRADVVLTPGKHTVVATRDGYQTLTHEIEAAAGSSETLRMSLSPVGDAAPGTVSGGTHDDASDAGPIWPLVIAGGVVGLGALGAGIGLHVAATSKSDDRDALAAQIDPDSGACNETPPDPRCGELAALNDDANTFSAAGTGLLIGGGVVLAATVVYLSVTLATSSSDEARLELVPFVTGALLRGTF